LTVAELISVLGKYDPALKVVTFHEESPQQVQFTRYAERVNLGKEVEWVVIRSSPITREDANTLSAR